MSLNALWPEPREKENHELVNSVERNLLVCQCAIYNKIEALITRQQLIVNISYYTKKL